MTIGIEYRHWKLEHESILKDFGQKEIFFLFSAGKDSSLTMHFMVKAAEEFGFAFQAHLGAFPVHRYNFQEKERISSYWEKRGIRPVWHEPKETDIILEDKEEPCLTCQSISKKNVARLFIKKRQKLEKPSCRNQLQSLGSGELCNGTNIDEPSG